MAGRRAAAAPRAPSPWCPSARRAESRAAGPGSRAQASRPARRSGLWAAASTGACGGPTGSRPGSPLFLGDDELARGTVKMRDLDSGEETELPIDRVSRALPPGRDSWRHESGPQPSIAFCAATGRFPSGSPTSPPAARITSGSRAIMRRSPPTVEAVAALRRAEKERDELAQLAAAGEDDELRSLAGPKLAALRARLPELERDLKRMLVPAGRRRFPRNAILELRPGTGGGEGGALRLRPAAHVSRYAEARGWRLRAPGLPGDRPRRRQGGPGAGVRPRCLPAPEVRIGRPTACNGSRPPNPRAASIPRRLPSPCCPRPGRSTSGSTPAELRGRHLSALRAPAASMSTRPTARYASPMSPAASSSRSRARNRSTRTAPGP